MMILDGKEVAKAIQEKAIIKSKILTEKLGRQPGLAVVLVGEDEASQVYVKNKEKACEKVGIRSFRYNLSEKTHEEDLLKLVDELNANVQVDGILVQLPLPRHINEKRILAQIDPEKDADCFAAVNMGRLWLGGGHVVPCTPKGVMTILDHYKVELEGKRAVVVGRSNIVGKPMAQLLLDRNATVTICHSKTKNISEITQQADLVVVAVGKPRFLGRESFKKGAIVVDVGIHRLDGKLCGDVRFDELEGWASAATPVPGGVGPMTISMLLENTLRLAEMSAR